MLLPPLTPTLLTVRVIIVFSYHCIAHNSTHDDCFDIISDFASYLFSSKDRENINVKVIS